MWCPGCEQDIPMYDGEQMHEYATLALQQANAAMVELLRRAMDGWDSTLEDLELNGLHDSPKFFYRKQKSEYAAIDAAIAHQGHEGNG